MTLKYQKIKGIYFTTFDHNKITSDTFDAKVKQKESCNKPDISNLVKHSELNTKLSTLARKAELKSEHDKIV